MRPSTYAASFVRLCLTVTLLLTCASASASRVEVVFDPEEALLRGATPRTHAVWLGMIRVWEGSRAHIRYVRGSGLVPADGNLKLREGIDTSSSMWLVTGLGDEPGVVRSSPGFPHSTESIEVNAVAGADSIRIRAGVVYGTYVRADGTTWAFAAGDGDRTDAGGVVDGWIVLPLRTLSLFAGNPAPPESVGVGDKVLLIDSEESRTAIVQVNP